MKLLKEIEPNVYELCIDNSAVEHLQVCPRSFEFNSVYKRVANKANPGLSHGSNIHSLLEHCVLPVPENRLDLFETAKKVYDKNPTGCDWRTAEFAINSISLYMKTWQKDKFTILPSPLEEHFKFFLEDVYFEDYVNYPKHLLVEGAEDDGEKRFYVGLIKPFWTGVIDARGEYDNGDRYVVDHKTSSIAGPGYYYEHRISSQLMGYTWVSRMKGEKVKGALVNLIVGRKPTQKGAGVPHEFARHPYMFSDIMLDEWYLDQTTLIDNFLNHLRRGFFPKHTKWCTNKFGQCPYNDCCSSQGGRDFALKQLMGVGYKENVWNPLELRS